MMNRPRDEWEIREDARALARAEEIKADRARMKEAQQMAQKMADEDIKRVSGMLKVAGRKPPKQSGGAKEVQPFNKRGYSNPATLGKLF